MLGGKLQPRAKILPAQDAQMKAPSRVHHPNKPGAMVLATFGANRIALLRSLTVLL
jgi:hypothetical protein